MMVLLWTVHSSLSSKLTDRIISPLSLWKILKMIPRKKVLMIYRYLEEEGSDAFSLTTSKMMMNMKKLQLP